MLNKIRSFFVVLEAGGLKFAINYMLGRNCGIQQSYEGCQDIEEFDDEIDIKRILK